MAHGIVSYLKNGSLPAEKLSIQADKNFGYTLPQRISGESDVRLSFRVRRPHQECVVQVRQNGKTIQRLHIKNALPAKMIQLNLSKEKISAAGDLEVTMQ